MTARLKPLSQQGITLIELILTIMIVSIALTGILTIVNQSVRHSADPLVQRQAIAIAESYLSEIMLLPVLDPDGSNASETRATFDNIDDYNGLNDSGAIDQNGQAVEGLNLYTVTVQITDKTVSGVPMKKITVTVRRAGTDSIRLSGYRATY